MARGDTKLRGFYFPWPRENVKMSRQWDAIREDTEKLAPIVRAVYVDPQPVTANAPGEHDVSGFAHGMRDFRNKFRIWYDQTNQRWALQHNIGTEDVETWDDIITARESDGRVTIVQFGGLEAPGGFYNQVPRNLATSGTFTLSNEWVFTHNLDTKPILWDTFNLEDKSILPQSVDVSDPNIAYFYFSTPQAGRAIVTGEQSRFEGIRVTAGDLEFPAATRLGFNNRDFYLSTDGHGMPVVNMQPIDITDFDLRDSFYGVTVRQSGTPGFSFRGINTIEFNSDSFYIEQTSPDTDKVIINFRGSVDGSGATPGGVAAQDFSASSEWQFSHNLNTSDLSWAVYDDQGYAFIPDKVSVHDPNTAYFYFNAPVTGRAVVVSASNTVNIVDTAALVFRNGTQAFLGDQSMGGFKLTNLGAPTSDNDAARKIDIGPGFYGVVFSDDVHTFKKDRIRFNPNHFYLSQLIDGTPEVNLRYSKDYLPAFVETVGIMNLALDPFAPYPYTIERVEYDTRTGSCTLGFYIVNAANRTKQGVAITGLDPLTASTIKGSTSPSGANQVGLGDKVVLSIPSNSSAKHLCVTITARR